MPYKIEYSKQAEVDIEKLHVFIAAEYKAQFGTSFYSDAELVDRKKTAAYDKVAAMLSEGNTKKKKDDNPDDTGDGN